MQPKKPDPFFVSAITKMSFQDAVNILMGNPDAATRYLEKTTYQRIVQRVQAGYSGVAGQG
jgi:hypothetical protein